MTWSVVRYMIIICPACRNSDSATNLRGGSTDIILNIYQDSMNGDCLCDTDRVSGKVHDQNCPAYKNGDYPTDDDAVSGEAAWTL